MNSGFKSNTLLIQAYPSSYIQAIEAWNKAATIPTVSGMFSRVLTETNRAGKKQVFCITKNNVYQHCIVLWTVCLLDNNFNLKIIQKMPKNQEKY